MVKQIVVFVVLIFATVSCKKTNPYCGVNNPVKDLPWLAKKVPSNSWGIKIYEITYNGNEGIFIFTCLDSGCVYTLTSYYTCSDSALYGSGGFIGTTYPTDFDEKVTLRKQIYP